MGKKKRRPKVPSLVGQKIDELDAVNSAAHRVNHVIQKMTAPPETVLDHLKRIGITPIIDQMALDGGPSKVYVVFGYDELMKKELHNITSGGAFKDTYPTKKPDANRAGAPSAPVILDEIRKRMEVVTEQVKQNPPAASDAGEERLPLKNDEDDWPITGESPSL